MSARKKLIHDLALTTSYRYSEIDKAFRLFQHTNLSYNDIHNLVKIAIICAQTINKNELLHMCLLFTKVI